MKFPAKLINENKEVTGDKNRDQNKPTCTLVLSVIGDSNTLVPNEWPTDVFQKALIETAKSEKGKVFFLTFKVILQSFQKDQPKITSLCMAFNKTFRCNIHHAETWILFRGGTGGVSKVVKEAYQDYDSMECFEKGKEESGQKRRIKLISTTNKEVR